MDAAQIHWKETKLGEVGDIQTGPFGSQLHESDYVDAGTPIITVEHLLNDRISHSRDIPKVSVEDTNRLKRRYALTEGDIVFSRVGSVDRSAYVSKAEDGWLFSGRLLRVRPNKDLVSGKWLDYWLRQQKIKQFVRQIAVGATMPSINTSLLEEVPVLLPNLNEQEKIANVFSSLDSKIELLRRQNETLEQVAQAIFNEWFVKPTADVALPEGWRMGTLGDIADNLRRGVRVQEMRSDTPYIGLEHMPRKSVALTEWGTANDLQSNKSAFNKGDLLFGKLRPYFHKVGIAPIAGVCSTDVLVIAPKSKEWFGLTFCTVSNSEFVRYTSAGAQGTKMPRTDWAHMSQYPLPIPPQSIATDFSVCVGALTNKILMNVGNIHLLSEIRDALLPRLMSGDVRIRI